ncbi:MAG: hypothetical protein OXI51_13950 [Chloroflexota bacterium]|nr:hypothetical protein [Chloroflexota bacterium]
MPDAYTVASVRAQVGRFLMGQLSRQQLDEWLFPLVWFEDGDREVVDLAWSVELLLMEASGGYLSEEELRTGLVTYADIPLGEPRPVVVAFASSSTFTRGQTLTWPVGAPLAVVSE